MGTLRKTIATIVAVSWLTCGSIGRGDAAEIQIAGNQVLLTGSIDPDTYHQFRLAIERSPTPIDTVILRGSPGGTVASAESIMTIIWNRGMTTAISGRCASACAVMFLAGKQRRFTDEQPTERTFLMFHGCYTTDGFANGTMRWNYTCSRQIERTVRDYTDQRLDAALLERWISVKDSRGGVFMFDSRRSKRSDGISAYFCNGSEARRVADCEALPGVDAYRLGFLTSPDLVRVNPALALPR